MKTVTEELLHFESKLGCAYVWGSTGQLCTTANVEKLRLSYKGSTSTQCPWNDGNNGYTYLGRCKKWINDANPIQMFDCGGMFDNLFGINTTAAGYYSSAKVKGKIDTIPKGQPGLQVFKVSSLGSIVHVGCYIGDGTVIEAKDTASGVVRTSFAGAGWDLWAECSYIDYTGEDDMIKLGSKGFAVGLWQVILIALGYYIGAFGPNKDGVDQSFGPTVQAQTLKFKADNGLPTTNEEVDETVFLAAKKALIAKQKVDEAMLAELTAANALVAEKTKLLGDKVIELGESEKALAEQKRLLAEKEARIVAAREAIKIVLAL